MIRGAVHFLQLLAPFMAALLYVGCAPPKDIPPTGRGYRHTESNARAALMGSRYVKRLSSPGRRLVSRVDRIEDAEVHLYLGNWGPDFDHRIGFFKVRPDGTVWRNADETGFDEQWVKIE